MSKIRCLAASLDRCRFSTAQPQLALGDLNENSFAVTARRAARYRRNVLEPLKLDRDSFDSIGLYYLLHCLPGDIAAKSVVFDHASAVLKPGGVIFGATLLQEGVPRSALAKRLMRLYNREPARLHQSPDCAIFDENRRPYVEFLDNPVIVVSWRPLDISR